MLKFEMTKTFGHFAFTFVNYMGKQCDLLNCLIFMKKYTKY